MSINQQKDYKFTDEQIENFAGFYNILKKIHLRLVNEGYVIKNGKVIPPNNNTLQQTHESYN